MTDTPVQTVETAVATATQGNVRTEDGVLDAPTRVAGEEKEGLTTPEHLMAAAIASCLRQAVVIAASTQGVDASSASVEGRCSLKTEEEAGYTSSFEIVVSGLDGDSAQRVLDQAKQFCPFTKALAGADLTVSLA